MLIKVKEDELYKALKHSTDQPIIQNYQQSAGRKRIMDLPVCPKCEKVALRDKGWAKAQTVQCPHCGYKGKATHQLSYYLQDGSYR